MKEAIERVIVELNELSYEAIGRSFGHKTEISRAAAIGKSKGYEGAIKLLKEVLANAPSDTRNAPDNERDHS